MLKHDPIPNTIYISGSGFPVMFIGMVKDYDDCNSEKVLYSLLTESFDMERKTMFHCPMEHFKERFSPISEYDAERKVFKRRVPLLILGSRFNTYGMLSSNDHNLKLLQEFIVRHKHPVRISSQTRDTGLPRYYTDDECKEAWLEHIRLEGYEGGKYQVLSADLVTDRLDDPYVQQFFPMDDEGRFVVPNRYVTFIQVESEEDRGEDGRVLLEKLHNAFALI